MRKHGLCIIKYLLSHPLLFLLGIKQQGPDTHEFAAEEPDEKEESCYGNRSSDVGGFS